jgi:ketosteroid isomerase-like protein
VLSAHEIKEALERWNEAWNAHDLEGVLSLFHEEVVFENWTGARVKGREALRNAWREWFSNHGGFRFDFEDLFVDEGQQKALSQWSLEWPSMENGFEGEREVRRGVDIIHFKDGKIIRKLTYCRTTVEIGGRRVRLAAQG